MKTLPDHTGHTTTASTCLPGRLVPGVLVAALLGLGMVTASAAERYRLLPLEILPGQSSAVFARDLNDARQVVGDARTRIGNRAFRWAPEEGARDLGSVDGGPVRTTAQAIDAEGRVTGSSARDARFLPDQAVLWPQPGRARGLDGPGDGDRYSRGRALGPAGVVGSARDARGERPFLWRETGGLQLLTAADGGPVFGGALDLNRRGEIVGYAHTDAGPRPLRGTAETGLRRLPLGSATGGRAMRITRDGLTAGILQRSGGFELALWNPAGELRRPGLEGAEPRDLAADGTVVGRQLTAQGARAFIWSETPGLRYLETLITADSALPGLRLYSAEAINGHGEIIAYGRAADAGAVRSYLLVPVGE